MSRKYNKFKAGFSEFVNLIISYCVVADYKMVEEMSLRYFKEDYPELHVIVTHRSRKGQTAINLLTIFIQGESRQGYRDVIASYSNQQANGSSSTMGQLPFRLYEAILGGYFQPF